MTSTWFLQFRFRFRPIHRYYQYDVASDMVEECRSCPGNSDNEQRGRYLAWLGGGEEGFLVFDDGDTAATPSNVGFNFGALHFKFCIILSTFFLLFGSLSSGVSSQIFVLER